MDRRRNIHPAYNEHIIPPSGMMRRMEPVSPVLLESKLASQAAEIEQLASDNRKLATSHLAMRRELEAAKEEAERLREHIRSTQTEADIQIRILLDKIAKMEADIRAGENIKRELQEAHIEARSLMASRKELATKIHQATKELDNSRANVKKLPNMHAELDRLRQEHQRLRKTFEYEKGINIVKVEQMRNLEKDLIGMAGEVERLRAEVQNAEQRVKAPPIPYVGPYMNQDNLYPPPFHGNGGYTNSSGGLHTVHGATIEGMNPYADSGYAVGPQVVGVPVVAGGGPVVVGGVAPSGKYPGGQVVGVDGGNPGWGGGVYGTSHAPM